MLTLSLAVMSIFLSAFLIFVIWRKNLFHIAIFFLFLGVVDVFFPAIYWTVVGQVNNPEWLRSLSNENILFGVSYYSVFLFIFIASILTVESGKPPPLHIVQLSVKAQARLLTALWVLLTLTLLKMGLHVTEYGGLESWFWSRFTFATVADLDNPSGGGPLAALPARELFQAAVGLAFFYRKKFPRPRSFAVVFPTIAVLLALTTFLRGAVLACAITLIFAETMRHRIEQQTSSGDAPARGQARFFAMAVLAAVLSMYVYGSIRDTFREVVASGDQDSTAELAVPTFLTAGHGLLGVSHIVAEYDQSASLLWGKTYLDMLLLPLPRSIYVSKPDWYGIDDITRGMGWPESTQSAVTMPGEAYANFGPLGLLVAVPLGLAFGWLQLLLRNNQIRFLLLSPTLFFQVASVANWMSFTGIMNAVPLLALLFALAAYVGDGVGGAHWPVRARPPRRSLKKAAR